ncbi:MAG: hypothetical protein FWH18_01670 [Marinilabiliaceae bacterium]|nr:hypothetical protein [Marinilabiliaceae bacterium]
MTKIVETIDNIPNERLLYVINNANDYKWNFLAVQVILTRLKMKILMFEDDNSIQAICCDELRNLLKKSSYVPNLIEDLKQIISIN